MEYKIKEEKPLTLEEFAELCFDTIIMRQRRAKITKGDFERKKKLIFRNKNRRKRKEKEC